MFTGLIEEIGKVRRINLSADGAGIEIAAKKVLSDLKKGDSVAVSGPCLTVTTFGKDRFTAWVMLETLKRTNLKNLSAGSAVNLERALSLGSRLGGHMVSGHIDHTVALTNKNAEGGAVILTFDCLPELIRYIVPKGSVALDGVSLTVVEVSQSQFKVGIIPYTAGETTLAQVKIGDLINLEVDLVGKYVEKMITPYHPAGEKDQSRGHAMPGEGTISLSFLQEKGYL